MIFTLWNQKSQRHFKINIFSFLNIVQVFCSHLSFQIYKLEFLLYLGWWTKGLMLIFHGKVKTEMKWLYTEADLNRFISLTRYLPKTEMHTKPLHFLWIKIHLTWDAEWLFRSLYGFYLNSSEPITWCIIIVNCILHRALNLWSRNHNRTSKQISIQYGQS